MLNGHWKAWLCLVVGLIAGAISFVLFAEVRETQVAIAWVGSVWAITYFLHQHELEKNRFFLELFREFNQRYDRMNDHLQTLRGASAVLSAEDRALVIDYFNLCAEEYLFYRMGYIPKNV